ncbi:MAG: hypothetical protein ACI80V_003644 [Rhodothermales bacterium]|jgi:hypothetical protein
MSLFTQHALDTVMATPEACDVGPGVSRLSGRVFKPR